jgi:uncharacterized membrane-anchored protein
MKWINISIFIIFASILTAQSPNQALIDSVENTIHYVTGKIDIGNKVATIDLGKAFKFIPKEDAVRVIESIWANPKRENITEGLVLPLNDKLLEQKSIVFNIQYYENYRVNDDNDIVYFKEFMEKLKSENTVEYYDSGEKKSNKLQYKKFLFDPIYDKNKKMYVIPKVFRIVNSDNNTINYNYCYVLKNSVLCINAIANQNDKKEMEKYVFNLIKTIQINEANNEKHSDSKDIKLSEFIGADPIFKMGLYDNLYHRKDLVSANLGINFIQPVQNIGYEYTTFNSKQSSNFYASILVDDYISKGFYFCYGVQLYNKDLSLELPNNDLYIIPGYSISVAVGLTELIKINNKMRLSISQLLKPEIISTGSSFFPALTFDLIPTLHINIKDVFEFKLSASYSQYIFNNNERYKNWNPSVLGLTIGIGR